MGGADHRSYGGEALLADEIRPPLCDELRHLMPDGTTVGEDEVLNLRAARIRRLDDAEDARAVTPARRQVGVERVAAEVRIHRQRVGERSLVVRRLEERRRVGARGRADVSAL